MKMKQQVKTSQRMTIRRRQILVAGGFAAGLIAIVLTIVLSNKTEKSFAASKRTITTKSDGDFSNSKIWDLSEVPKADDSIVIQHKVNLDQNFTVGSNSMGAINVTSKGSLSGTSNTINLQAGARLFVAGIADLKGINYWDKPSYVFVYSTGNLTLSSDLGQYGNTQGLYNYGIINLNGKFYVSGTVVNTGTFSITGDLQIDAGTITNNAGTLSINSKVDMNGGTIINSDSKGVIKINGQLTLNNGSSQGSTLTNKGYLNIGTAKANQNLILNDANLTNSGSILVSGKLTLNTPKYYSQVTNDGLLSITGDVVAYNGFDITNSDSMVVKGNMSSGLNYTLEKNAYLYVGKDLSLQNQGKNEFINNSGFTEVDGNFTNDWGAIYTGNGGGISVAKKSYNNGTFQGATDFCDKTGRGKGGFDDNKGTFDTKNTTICSYSPPAPLPVRLLSFTATESEGAVRLKWTTASEENNERFDIERSTDGFNYQVLDKVAGKGTTLITQYYQFLDNEPTPGMVYYRLHQWDYNGQNEYSKTISLRTGAVAYKPAALQYVKLYPNPAKSDNQVNVEFQIPTDGMVIIQLLNLGGHEIYHKEIKAMKGQNTTQISLDGILPATYLLRSTYQGKIENSKLIVL